MTYEPLSKEEIEGLQIKSVFRTTRCKEKKHLTWPANPLDMHDMIFVTGYPNDEEAKRELFYNYEDIKLFRRDKYFEDHADEFEEVYESSMSSDDSYYYEEVVVEDDDDDYEYKELVEEVRLPVQGSSGNPVKRISI